MPEPAGKRRNAKRVAVLLAALLAGLSAANVLPPEVVQVLAGVV